MPPADAQARRARRAVSALFFTNGALLANLFPRYPDIKDALGLSDAAYGAAVACIPGGALVVGLLAPTLIRRFRSSRVAVCGTVALALSVLAAGAAPGVAALVAAFVVLGSADALTDVAQNAHGLRIQRRYGRSIVNGFHGLWSVGAVLGGLMGAAATGLHIPLPVHFAVSAVVFTTVALAAFRSLLPGPEDAGTGSAAPPSAPPGPLPRRRLAVPAGAIMALAMLGLVAVSGAFVEDAGASWSALYLGRDLGAPGAVAGLGYVAMMIPMMIGRLTADRLVDRYGPAAVVRAGGLLTALGMGAALAVPSVPLTLVGLACAGLGVSTHIPAAMHAANELRLAPGVGLTVIGWVMRVGFLASPALVGLVAEAVSLRAGLAAIVLAGALTLLCASRLGGRRAPARL